ncbi:CHAT domain-containing WD40 repeat protein [Streptomyces telluris]|uniref:CHAT domain-containing protein n=1 Tax=Streptomyces telluris TaxID=2720021 RepID=A0A9X2RSB2_9ACTN|nr:CHAT domain-containing protein [Streptomyces telluris]MCQ8774165.1 CHAT domain-containing protein [Streptomyces telluris]NJP76173.1 CHAT domain-containing protein [Streptomyces telluris]
MRGAADFVLEVSGGGPGGRYTVAVSSPAGEGSLAVDLDPVAIGARLADLQRAVLASSVTPRAAALGLERPVREVGERLFRAVFDGHLRGLYLASRQHAGERDQALRVVLRIRAPELAALPWELLYDEESAEYLCLRRPLVRYVDLPEPLAPLRSEPPLKILGMTSLPRSRAPLGAESERAALSVALGPLTERGLADLDWVPGQTADDLSRRLLRGCHVLHFIGHGAYDPQRHEGMITLAGADGREHHLHASALASLLSVARPRPQLVVLNSCQSGMGNAEDLFSSTAAVLVRTVPAVVAMQFAVTDKAATRFAASFYQALAQGRTVDEAVRVGRIALVVDKDDSLEWATPVLYLRGGDARLFDMPAAWAQAGPAVPLPGTDPVPPKPPTPPATANGRPAAAAGPPAAPGGALAPPGAPPMAPGAAITSRVLDTRQWVHALAFHPDGRRLATGSRNRVRVWDALTGNRIWEQPVGGWLSSVFAAAFSPGGRRLVTGGADNTVRIWASSNGEELLRLRHDHVVFGVAFSPDGFRVASASADRTVRLWDSTSGDPMLRITHDQVVTDVAFSPDGTRLASASADRSVRLWSLGGDALLRLRHDHAVKAVAFSPDGGRLATAGDDGCVRVWDAGSGHRLLLVRHGDAVKDVAFSPGGHWLATASADRTAGVWAVADGTRALRVQHHHTVFCVAFGPDGGWLASGSEDKTVKLTPVPGECG